MKKSKFTEQQTAFALQQAETGMAGMSDCDARAGPEAGLKGVV